MAILSGDPVSNKVSGYYAMDSDGYGGSTDLYTLVPEIFGDCKFIVFAMEDNTEVELTDAKTGDVIYKGTLNKGEYKVLPYSRGTNTYFTVKSDDTVTVLAQPWNTMTSTYQQGVYVADENGTGIGKNFYPTALSNGYLYAFAYFDNTEINLYDNTGTTLIKSYKLNAGEYVDLAPGSGLFNVTSSKNISLYSGYAQASAGFVPVQYNNIERPSEGTWDIVKEGDTDKTYWSDLKWTEEIPERTNINVANTKDDLRNAKYVDVVNGVSNEELRGKFIEVNVELTTTNIDSPILKDITIGQLPEYDQVITAEAGENQDITIPRDVESCSVTLDGSKSYDLNGNLLSYK